MYVILIFIKSNLTDQNEKMKNKMLFQLEGEFISLV